MYKCHHPTRYLWVPYPQFQLSVVFKSPPPHQAHNTPLFILFTLEQNNSEMPQKALVKTLAGPLMSSSWKHSHCLLLQHSASTGVSNLRPRGTDPACRSSSSSPWTLSAPPSAALSSWSDLKCYCWKGNFTAERITGLARILNIWSRWVYLLFCHLQPMCSCEKQKMLISGHDLGNDTTSFSMTSLPALSRHHHVWPTEWN